MDKKDEILFRAENVMFYNDLLIKQCDSWLPAEEGNKIMMMQIMDRKNETTYGAKNGGIRNKFIRMTQRISTIPIRVQRLLMI